ncbi:MAG: glycosyltransferase family 4 protein [Pirellulales bacterium]
MRIVHIITRLIVGGAQENTLLTCEGLSRDYGDDVVLITGPGLGPEGSLVEQARCRQVSTIVLPDLRRAIHPLRDWRSYRAIVSVLNDLGPEVVHTHSAKAGLLGRCAASKLGVPAIVHTVHGAPFHAYQGRGARALFRHCEWYAAIRCHALVSVADAMTDQLVAAGVAPREKFVTIHSGMEVGPFLNADDCRAEVRKKLGYSDEHVVIGTVARLFHLKGHDDLIDVARRVVDRQPKARFLWVGGGRLQRTLQARIERVGLAPFIQITGLVPPTRIPEMIGAMDLVVHASLREGLARVLPQALIAGRPVVCYDIDGAREVVIHGETGYLIEPRQIEPMADAICELASSEPLRRRLAEEGRRRFTDRFRHETMTRRLRELYTRLLGSKLER